MAHWAGLLLQVCWIAWAAVWAVGWLYTAARGPRARRGGWDRSALLAIAAARGC